ncbi:MAG: MerR family transcriptional regulator [Saprospiraceae bacterium]
MDILPLTKLYYSIGEVADIFGIAPSMIRYWESEFRQLSPGKNSKGDRKYTVKDIDMIHQIYHLVKEKGFTIEGAGRALDEIKKAKKEDEALVKQLKNIKHKLVSLRDSL